MLGFNICKICCFAGIDVTDISWVCLLRNGPIKTTEEFGCKYYEHDKDMADKVLVLKMLSEGGLSDEDFSYALQNVKAGFCV